MPKEVPPALEKWGVLSSKVLYFEREKRGGFRAAENIAPLALATANTHDMATIAGFLEGRDIELRRKDGPHRGRRSRARRSSTEPRSGEARAAARLTREGMLPSAARA